MRRFLMLVLMVALVALVFAPVALAQDDNPSGDDLRGDDRGGERGFDDDPSRNDLIEDNRGEIRGFDDNPTGDDIMSSPTATASATASAAPTASATPTASVTAAAAQYKNSATALPDTGGSVPTAVLAVGAGALLVGGGLLARRFMG